MAVFDKATLVGAGLVGPQIGVVLSQHCNEVHVYDQNSDSLSRAINDMRGYINELANEGMLHGDPDEVHSRIKPANSLEDAVEDSPFVMEAIFENIEAKQELYKQLGQITDPSAILASNTSTIPIRHMAEACANPERVVGSHFVLPAHILPLVEVIKHPQVDQAAIDTTYKAWESMGKLPIHVHVDIPGFVANRLQHSLTRQAIELFESGVASAEDIDNAVRYGFGARFVSVGPLGGRDLGGIINHSKVATYLYHELDGNEDVAAQKLRDMAAAGQDGVRTHKGFHDWTGEPSALRDFHYKMMIDVIKKMNAIGGIVTDENDIPQD